MKFGIFLAPFHDVTENPTLALERDLELIQLLDKLGYDEAWIGEHHSAGWETIASPEVFMGVAAERTRNIKLGTGVVSLPYHHPLMVANRMVLLDHLTRGRVMLGVGPGALASDALMIGIDPPRQREMMAQSLEAIVQLLTSREPVTYETDWFKLTDATLHLRPYSTPCFPIAVASVQSPSGVVLAGKYGFGVLSLSSFLGGLRGAVDPKAQWAIAEAEAAKHGKTMERGEWRLVTPIHIAETRQQALDEIRVGAMRFLNGYWFKTLGNKPTIPNPDDDSTWIEQFADSGQWIIGTPDDCIERIEELMDVTGGFGGLMHRAHDWAHPDALKRSYELLARHVMPRYQGSLDSIVDSWQRTNERTGDIRTRVQAAIERAHLSYDAAKVGAH
jgi:limonene 1,2-monooxygenase